MPTLAEKLARRADELTTPPADRQGPIGKLARRADQIKPPPKPEKTLGEATGGALAHGTLRTGESFLRTTEREWGRYTRLPWWGKALVKAAMQQLPGKPLGPVSLAVLERPEIHAASAKHILAVAKDLREIREEHPDWRPYQADTAWELLDLRHPTRMLSHVMDMAPFMAATTAAYAVAGPGGAGVVAYAVESQGAYEDAIENGADQQTAEWCAQLVGGVNAIIEIAQVGHFFKFGRKVGKQIAKDAGRKATQRILRAGAKIATEGGKMAGRESLEEIAQGVVQDAVGHYGYGKEINWDRFWHERAIEGVVAAFSSFLPGGAVGVSSYMADARRQRIARALGPPPAVPSAGERAVRGAGIEAGPLWQRRGGIIAGPLQADVSGVQGERLQTREALENEQLLARPDVGTPRLARARPLTGPEAAERRGAEHREWMESGRRIDEIVDPLLERSELLGVRASTQFRRQWGDVVAELYEAVEEHDLARVQQVAPRLEAALDEWQRVRDIRAKKAERRRRQKAKGRRGEGPPKRPPPPAPPRPPRETPPARPPAEPRAPAPAAPPAWDFENTFPAPTPEAVRERPDGDFPEAGDVEAERDFHRQIGELYASGILGARSAASRWQEIERTGRDPATGREIAEAKRDERIRQLKDSERTSRASAEGDLAEYADIYGQDAAEAFRRALDEWIGPEEAAKPPERSPAESPARPPAREAAESIDIDQMTEEELADWLARGEEEGLQEEGLQEEAKKAAILQASKAAIAAKQAWNMTKAEARAQWDEHEVDKFRSVGDNRPVEELKQSPLWQAYDPEWHRKMVQLTLRRGEAHGKTVSRRVLEDYRGESWADAKLEELEQAKAPAKKAEGAPYLHEQSGLSVEGELAGTRKHLRPVDAIEAFTGKPGIEEIANEVFTNQPVWVYRNKDGVPVGTLRLQLDPRRGNEPFLADVVVEEEYQRQGIATALVEAARAAGHDVDLALRVSPVTAKGKAFVEAVAPAKEKAAEAAPEKPAKTRIQEKAAEARQEFTDAVDELGDYLRDQGLLANPLGNPKLAGLVAKALAKGAKAGIYSFAEAVESLVKSFGAKAVRNIAPVIEQQWARLHKADRKGRFDAAGSVAEVLGKEKPAGPEAPRKAELSGAPAVLEKAGLIVRMSQTRSGKRVWNVSGNTFQHKDMLKALGARYYRKGKSWSFYDGDPTERIAAELERGRGPGEDTGEGAGRGDGGAEDLERQRRRREEDGRPDESRVDSDRARYVSDETRDLIFRGAQQHIPPKILEEQTTDTALIVRAFEGSKRCFLLASEAGTGKTFVLGAAMRELLARGAERFIYVTMNRRLIGQIQEDLADYGILDATQFVTYAAIRKGKIDATGAVVIFDESQNIKSAESQQGIAGAQLIADARMAIFASATPFENPVQAAYIEPTGVFAPVGGHHEWAKMYGADVIKKKWFDYASGQEMEVETLRWSGGRHKRADQIAARRWFLKQGIFTQRAKKLDPHYVESQFRKSPVSSANVELVGKLLGAYAAAARAIQRVKDAGPIDKAMVAMHEVNCLKRALEAGKVGAAIARAKELIAAGKQVVIFVETKADRHLGKFRRSGDSRGRLHSADEIAEALAHYHEAMREWRQLGGSRPKRPFAQSIYQIALAMEAAGLAEAELPSVVGEIRGAFAAGDVAIYTGDLSNSQAEKQLDQWKAGERKLLIATMAKGGTGLSLHDTTGEMPERVQIGLNLPWTASGVDQVSGRLARYGTAKTVGIEWLFADNIAFERDLAFRVGARMTDMGALVKGIKLRAGEALEAFDFEDGFDPRNPPGEREAPEQGEIEEESEAEELYRRAAALERGRSQRGGKIAGFFETPFPLGLFMGRVAGVRKGDALLEPSAGRGNLLRLLPRGVKITAIELYGGFREQLEAALGDRIDAGEVELHILENFLDVQTGRYDVVLMNPPFERLKSVGWQDVTHVTWAYEQLKAGGRLVAIMCEGPFFREDRQCRAFREWLDEQNAHVVKLPRETFKQSGTQVATRLVILDKGGDAGLVELDLAKVDAESLLALEGEIVQRLEPEDLDEGAEATPPKAPEPLPLPEPEPEPQWTPGEAKEMLDGKAATIEAPAIGLVIPCRYAAIELADLIASHDMRGGGPQSNVREGLYPPALQPRDYAPGSAEAAKVVGFGQQQKVGFYISDHPAADSGPACITKEGIVINGNARVMSLQYAAGVLNQFDWYRDALIEQAESFGLDAKDVQAMDRPVLVRVVDMAPDGEEAVQFARAGNVSTTQALSPLRLAESLKGMIDQELIESIHLEADTTFSEAVTQRTGRNFREALRRAIPDSQAPQYFHGDGRLTEAGTELVRFMLLAQIAPIELIERLGAERRGLRRTLEGSIPQLLNFRRQSPDQDVTYQLLEAMEFMADQPEVKGAGDAVLVLDQGALFGEAKVVMSPGGRMMLDFVLADGYRPNAFRAKLKRLLHALSAEVNGLFASQAPEIAELAAEALEVEERPGARFGPPPRRRGAVGAVAGAMAAISDTGAYGAVEQSPTAGRQPRGRMGWRQSRQAVADQMPPLSKQLLDAVAHDVAPPIRTTESREAARVMASHLAALARWYRKARWELRKARRAFALMPWEQCLEFIDRMETGKPQGDPRLDRFASALREMLDNTRDDVRALGKGRLEHCIENYFPHLWKDPAKAKAVLASFLGRRPLEGPKSFLKKRSIMTVKEGVKAGLEPTTENPVDVVLTKCFEMRRFVMAQQVVADYRSRGLCRFVYARSRAPATWERLEDNAFRVFLPPEIPVKEAFDKLLVEQLVDFARSLGIDTQRYMKLGGQKWGEALMLPKRVKGRQARTRFAGPESVLIHEIGHIFAQDYRLWPWLQRITATRELTRGPRKGQHVPTKEAIQRRKRVNEELRALADARWAGQETGPSFKSYVRGQFEKEAVIAEAYLHAPELMERLAPTVKADFEEFLRVHPELLPFADIRPSVVLGQGIGKVPVPGVTEVGRFWAPEPVARIVNNYLSPGLRGSQSKIIAGTFNALRMTGNVLNQANLALSAFHAINVAVDSCATAAGLGMRELTTKGQRARGLKHLALGLSGAAFPTALVRGHKLQRAYLQELETIQDPELRAMVASVVLAGGRAETDPYYYNRAGRALVQSVREVLYGGIEGRLARRAWGAGKIPLQLPAMALEAVAKPIMSWLVPKLKMGSFYLLAQHELARHRAGQISAEQLHERLYESWQHMDNRLGLLVYDNLFWNRYFKDGMMLTLRAVGWNIGSWREFGGMPWDILSTKARMQRGDLWLSQKMAYCAASAMIYAAVGATITYLCTGRPPDEPKDYVFPKTGGTNPDGSPERLSLPTYAKDWYAWTTRPVTTFINKLHPMWRLLSECFANEDFYGGEIRNRDDPAVQQFREFAEHVGKGFLPFSVRNYMRMQKAEDNPWRSGIVSSTGIQSAPGYVARTPAQKLMMQCIADHKERGARSRESVEAGQIRWRLRDAARRGTFARPKEARERLDARQLARIHREAALPPFTGTFKVLRLREALNVFAIATGQERQQAAATLEDKYFGARDDHPEFKELAELYRELMGPYLRRSRPPGIPAALRPFPIETAEDARAAFYLVYFARAEAARAGRTIDERRARKRIDEIHAAGERRGFATSPLSKSARAGLKSRYTRLANAAKKRKATEPAARYRRARAALE